MTSERRISLLVLTVLLGGCGLYDPQLYLDRRLDGGDTDGHTDGDSGEPNDVDGDGIANADDICPSVADPAQRDFDADGAGDVCDPDGNGDGVDDPDVAEGSLRYVEVLDFLVQDVCVDESDTPVADDPYDCVTRGLRVRSQRLDETLVTIRHDPAAGEAPHGTQVTASVLWRLYGGRLGVLNLLDARDVGPNGEIRAYQEFDRYGSFSATNPANTAMTDAPLDGYVLTEVSGLVASIISRCDPEAGVIPVHGRSSSDPSSCTPDDAWIVAGLDTVPAMGTASAVATFRDEPTCTGTFDRAFTEWQVMPDVEFSGDKTMDALVSDHYAAALASNATSFERTYYTRPYGRTRWERWSKTGPAATGECAGATTENGFFRVECDEWTEVESGAEYDVRAWPVDARIARSNLLVNHDFGDQAADLAGWQRSSATDLSWELVQEPETGALNDNNRHMKFRWVSGLMAPRIFQDVPRSSLQAPVSASIGVGGGFWAAAEQTLSIQVDFLDLDGNVVSSEMIGDPIAVNATRRVWSATFALSVNASVTTLRLAIVPAQKDIDYFVDDLWLTVVQ